MKNLRNFTEDRIEMKDLHLDVFTVRIFKLHIIAGVFAEEDGIADFEELGGIRAFFANTSFAECNDDSLLRLLTGSGIGDDDARSRYLLLLKWVNHDAVTEGLNCHGEAWNFLGWTIESGGCHRMKGGKM